MADWSKRFSVAGFRLVFVDRLSCEETGEVPGVVTDGASVSRNDDTETKESCELGIVGSFEAGSQLVRLYADVEFEDGTSCSESLGTFEPNVKSSSYSGAAYDLTLSLDGRLCDLAQDAFDAPFTVPEGTPTVAYVRQIAEGCGLDVISDASTHTVSSARNYGIEADESKLSVVDDLLSLANFSSARFDAMGRLLLRQYREPSERTPSWRFFQGDGSRMLRSVSVSQDESEVANVVQVIYQTEEATVVGVAVDDDPTSRWSTVARGRRIVARYSYDDEATQAQADAKAAELLRTGQSVVRKVSLSHAYVPVTIGDAVDVDYPDAGVEGRFSVRTQDISLSPGLPTTYELTQYVRR